MKSKIQITIIICTRDRSNDLSRCLKSILTQDYNFSTVEVIVVDQSKNDLTKKLISSMHNPNIKYFRNFGQGLGTARNFGIKRANGNFIAFTDDDCLVTKNWLKNINTFFLKYKKTDGVFGQALPYQSEKHINQLCPSTYSGSGERVVHNPYLLFYEVLGVGNNMIFKKEVFSNVGFFKEWLGPGSATLSGEEGEFVFRMLKRNLRLMFSSKIIIYHNRWLTYTEEQILQGKYSCGLIAYYFYYFFKGDRKIMVFIKSRIEGRVLNKVGPLLKMINHFKFRSFYHQRKELIYIYFEINYMLKGFLTGSIISLKEQIKSKLYFL